MSMLSNREWFNFPPDTQERRPDLDLSFLLRLLFVHHSHSVLVLLANYEVGPNLIEDIILIIKKFTAALLSFASTRTISLSQ
jgi:hypothetical protein